jgi:hypothetical protein
MRVHKFAIIVFAAALGFGGAYLLVSAKLDRERADAAAREADWAAQRTALETQLENARNRAPEISTVAVPAVAQSPLEHDSAAEILNRLRSLQAVADSPRNSRRVIHELEKLLDLGAPALPAIRQFLAQGTDVRYGPNRPLANGRIPMTFTLPPTLRLALLEITRQIGGDQTEEILADVFKSSGNGTELAYSAYALQELVPGKYRDAALAAARDSLSRQSAATPDTKTERDYLFGVLAFYGDSNYVATAQNQLVQPDGKIDKGAINYLQSILGPGALPLVQQAWQDSRIAPDQKEPLARVALTFAGANAQADQFYQSTINDGGLSAKQRKNLIEDLNETGFANPSHLTQADLPLIQNRISLIEQLAPNAMDKVNAAAFQEAYKDLLNMRASVLSPTDKPK